MLSSEFLGQQQRQISKRHIKLLPSSSIRTEIEQRVRLNKSRLQRSSRISQRLMVSSPILRRKRNTTVAKWNTMEIKELQASRI